MNKIRIAIEDCTACENCVDVCPVGAITMEHDHAVISDMCNLCGLCIDECPSDALKMPSEQRAADGKIEHLSHCRDIWVFAEIRAGEIAPAVYELLGKARQLVKGVNQNVCAVLLGGEVAGLVDPLIHCGADTVYLVDHPILQRYRDEPFVDAVERLVREFEPLAILIGATALGRSFAPRLAARLHTGLSADCTALELRENGLLVQIRPAYGGSFFASIICPHRWPQIATVRPRVMQAMEPDEKRTGHVIVRDYDLYSLTVRTKVLDFISQTESIGIEDASVVVGAGFGLDNESGLNLANDLAEAFGGALGASRKLVDMGKVPYRCQIGQTGKIINPDLYIACGISGAVQHTVGIRSAKTIAAINIDSDAPIFRIANFGIEGDVYEILPLMIEEIGLAKENWDL